MIILIHSIYVIEQTLNLIGDHVRTFTCRCGNRLFFENSKCLKCKRRLGFDAETMQLIAIDPIKPTNRYSETKSGSKKLATHWQGTLANGEQKHYRLCQNTRDHQVCNWLVPAESDHKYCLACRMNEMIPSLTKPENLALWESMEISKHRLLYTLLRLGLPISSKQDEPLTGLAFAFLEDQPNHKDEKHQHVITGHAEGLITVNLKEADSSFREAQRQQFSESYRTLLGHFRHESGHYFWERLVADQKRQNAFRQVFGDERKDYKQALERYYKDTPERDYYHFISHYAQSHPFEDYAETWAHYLHMFDTLETASDFGLINYDYIANDFDRMAAEWSELSVMMNSLNRSMGLSDAYPFVLTVPVREKLRFIHDQMTPTPAPTQS